ncbi:MAG TPA: class I SAM-dependent methyltransferase [Pseudolabrys sp.]|nr:class I SAM-dependent methyltransferase [Pseudolabrys sp.]
MAKIDFDQYAGQYEALIAAQTGFFDRDNDYFVRYKVERAKALAGQSLTDEVDAVLDFGCGVGRAMPYFRAAFPRADVVGCDPSADSLAIARRDNPDCRFSGMDELSAATKFDLVLASCVFHHIPPAERQDALRYCHDRLKPGGHFVIFEHNPFNPVTRHLVNTCPFDADAVLLRMGETVRRMREAQFEIAETGYCLFFPAQLAALRPLEKYLSWLPLGGQYFVSGIRA